MMNLTKFPFFLILIIVASPIFSELNQSESVIDELFGNVEIKSEEIFLDCILDFDIHEIDIDLDKSLGKWVPYTSKIFTENASDPQFQLRIDQNKTRVLFGQKPFDFIEIDLKTLPIKARARILIGMKSDSLAGDMEGDGLSGGMEGDGLSGDMEGDGLTGGMEGDGLAGDMGADGLAGGMEGDGLTGGMEGDGIAGDMGADGLAGGILEGICEEAPSRKNNS